jgi:bacterioferritin-associated ferredoxin
MIICSCNVFSDQQVRSALAKAPRLRMSQVFDRLGSSVRCGRCAHTIKRIMEKITANANLHTIPQQQALSRAFVAKSAAALLGGG